MTIKKENITIYQIYPKSFQDSNGDGIGDINGIIQRLDYIQDLGVDMIWLTPVFISPMKDNGYDVADYRNINPLFGSMEDFDRLVLEAKKRNIEIMLDMVFNHTSTDHYWFKEAINGNKKYKDYYIFSDHKTNWKSKFGGSCWEYVESMNQYYLHLFDVTQADLNWENPNVRQELYDIVNFWISKGVRGFRFDVVNLISKPEIFEDDYEGDGRRFYTDGPKIHEYLRELNKETFGKYSDIVTVGEMSSTNLKDCALYSNSEHTELSMIFSFHHLKVDYKDGQKWELDAFEPKKLFDMWRTWQIDLNINSGWNALFLNNHDQPRSVSRFGSQKYHSESSKAIATALFLMKGTPFIYQGEEIGLPNAHYNKLDMFKDVESLNYISSNSYVKSKENMLEILNQRSRDNGRTPMIWDKTSRKGFSSNMPWLDYTLSEHAVSVKESIHDQNSILAYYKKIIAFRKCSKVIQEGDIKFLELENPNVFVYERILENETYRVITSFSKEIENYNSDVSEFEVVISNYETNTLSNISQLLPFMTLVLKKNHCN
ncbi:alpha,alpha-phosphotrehalase [Erysipelothrix inopinata]|uniref:Alpha,alpha-phosphotrehalase n=1 Tax=Erysipelothrix inopinata TaxID=225084 RepID=A0A7G9RW98_9FIRM|nr:alpha,alpha-phosphotrehalase [Erysipelothrix inopinata]QNN59873.1 alpha,alpha-phosphotrehalase [Erysipelothrix inopinata]